MTHLFWHSSPGARALLLAAALLLNGAQAALADESFDRQLLDIQNRWAEANYRADGRTQKQAFDALLEDARAFESAHPDRAEARVWHGIVASSYAGVKGPFGALALAKEARAALEAAEGLDPSVLDGSVYTSLGALYYKVPGGMIGFGDRDKARDYLQKALEANPAGMDPNYFYAEFMFEQDEYDAAREALLRARNAPPRPARPLADQGRRIEVDALLEKVNAKLGREG
ncbi:MAG: tetratricopeptide repeat protein [Gammaproteobacteria bacterium]|nr:tetratricopeptide repeat protein [Gammaproteobacteria bacterium]MDH4256086.1 tetratricopeptide repeat protein [Gammaproteobacteria bacterium]MDH5311430.1 tetratricopeptide repeat protein [Gammaproteobacteria bacterium]